MSYKKLLKKILNENNVQQNQQSQYEKTFLNPLNPSQFSNISKNKTQPITQTTVQPQIQTPVQPQITPPGPRTSKNINDYINSTEHNMDLKFNPDINYQELSTAKNNNPQNNMQPKPQASLEKSSEQTPFYKTPAFQNNMNAASKIAGGIAGTAALGYGAYKAGKWLKNKLANPYTRRNNEIIEKLKKDQANCKSAPNPSQCFQAYAEKINQMYANNSNAYDNYYESFNSFKMFKSIISEYNKQ